MRASPKPSRPATGVGPLNSSPVVISTAANPPGPCRGRWTAARKLWSGPGRIRSSRTVPGVTTLVTSRRTSPLARRASSIWSHRATLYPRWTSRPSTSQSRAAALPPWGPDRPCCPAPGRQDELELTGQELGVLPIRFKEISDSKEDEMARVAGPDRLVLLHHRGERGGLDHEGTAERIAGT